MDKVTDIEAELVRDNRGNPRANGVILGVTADALRVYAEAAANVRAHGAIVSHPRTAQPMENPYLKIMTAQAKFLTNLRGIKIDRVFALLRDERVP